MGIFDWFWGALQKLGLANKDAKILFLGLDNAGKTTLMYMLRDGKLGQHVPTYHPSSQELIIGKIKFTSYDLGGHETARRIWKDYLVGVDGIVYLMDAADATRFAESAHELQGLLQAPELQSVPIMILGNKIDKPGAAPQEHLAAMLGLPAGGYGRTQPNDGRRPVELFMCSIMKQMGYTEGFQWLSQYI